MVDTLWEVEQTAAVRFASGFYAALARRVGTEGSKSEAKAETDSVARATHEAMMALRADDPEGAVTCARVVCFGA